MKKQWLSIVLVLCMVLCLAPATARAEEDEKNVSVDNHRGGERTDRKRGRRDLYIPNQESHKYYDCAVQSL